MKRTPTSAEGGITAEEREKLGAISQKWIANAFRTDTIDKEKITDAIYRLYEAAGLERPRVVIVPSPFVGRIASGIAASVWYLRKNKAATKASTDVATDDAMSEATDAATYAATREATWGATNTATWGATNTATREATDTATWEATDAATREATIVATWDATDAATREVTIEATDVATRRATDEATNDEVWASTIKATVDATVGATNASTNASTIEATRDATDAATREATWGATNTATWGATNTATREATDTATWEATDAAMSEATDAATYTATWEATDAATREVTRKNWLIDVINHFTPNHIDFTMECIRNSSAFYQGGNMWAGFLAYAEGMRDVIGLSGLPCWDKYQAWEDAGREGGFRYMHEKFCIVSDFPETLKVNDRNQPHSTKGPSHRWRDGFEIYHLNGVRFPKELFEKVTSENVTAKDILSIEDVDQRTQAMRFLPPEAMIEELKGVLIDEYNKIAVNGENVNYKLYRFPKGNIFTEDAYYVLFDCPSTRKRHFEGFEVAKTVPEAMAWAEEISEEEWKARIPLLHEV